MITKTARINENGMAHIKDALSEFHKLDIGHFTQGMLGAWAADAESHFDNSGIAYFEIRENESKTGRVELVKISDDGYDIEEIDDNAG